MIIYVMEQTVCLQKPYACYKMKEELWMRCFKQNRIFLDLILEIFISTIFVEYRFVQRNQLMA